MEMKTEEVEENIHSKRQRTISESYTSTKNIRNSHNEFSSIENLEGLLTCPIHLGLIDEPRQLQCGHTFCLSCLENYISHSESKAKKLCCPLCRRNTQIDHRGISSLAPSFLHKQLTEYLVIKKKKVSKSAEQYDLESTSDKALLETKMKLLDKLLNDLEAKEMSLTDLSLESNNNSLIELQSILCKPEFQSASQKFRPRSKSDLLPISMEMNENINSTVLQSFDQNTIRKNMHKYREYGILNPFPVNFVYPITDIAWRNTLEIMSDKISMIYIVQNSPSIFLANFQGRNLNSFEINIGSDNLMPAYVKCHSNMIFVSGKIGLVEKSCLIQLSLKGEKEKTSQIYSGILGGFCFDFTNNSTFIAYPTKHQVLLFDESLTTELKIFEFGNLSPMFVALSAKTREIWVSCPTNGRIAVYDEVTDNYLHLATNQIFDSIPTHIIETYDHRILFLDAEKSRLFWVLRWNNCLYTQLLLIMGISEDFKMVTIESITNNKLLVSDGRKTYIAKPNRSPKEEHQKNKCLFL